MAGFEFLDRKVIAWAFYDWANSAFALSVLAVLFPLFLGSYWSGGASGAEVTARLAWITSAASAVICLLAPVLGTIADAGGLRKRFLLIFALVGSVSTAALGFVGEGQWPLALFCYAMGFLGYYASTTFYDALLVDVTKPRYFSAVSTMGFSIGYLGGAVLLAIHVLLLLNPSRFGFADATEVIQFAFISVGLWWACFAIPILAFVPEKSRARKTAVIRSAYRQLKQTILHVGRYRNVVIFLCAYCLYIGGVFTVIFMAVNFGQRLGFEQQDLVTALLVTNFAGFPATLAYGWLGHRFGPRTGVYLALVVYTIVSVFAIFISNVGQFFAMAIVIGCVQGGIQGLSRSLYASLIPEEHSGEFFGFYNMVTKLSHVIGPALVGAAAGLFTDPQWVLLVLMPLFVAGGLLLTRVRLDAPHPSSA